MKDFAYFKQVAIGAASGAAVLALIVGGFTVSMGGTPTVSPSKTTAETKSASPTPSESATNARSCSVLKMATDPRLGELHAAVVNSTTGELLFDRLADQQAPTASLLKAMTATAAIQSLGPNYRVDTRVYQDMADPGTIIIVGGGDVTLSRTSAGKQSVYKDAPKLSDLAVQVNAALAGTPVTRIIADDSLFSGPKWLDSWERSEQTIGYMSEVSALQVDGDRANASKETSPRSTDPTLKAAKSFRTALGDLAVSATVEVGALTEGANQIAKVSSQPISKWITHMLAVSDNTQAEALARLVAINEGFDGSFDSIDIGVKTALTNAGLSAAEVATIHLEDGSGLSNLNRVSPLTMTKLMKILADAKGDLSNVRNALPVSGETGSLAARFTGKNADAAGHILAKTGWINHGYTLGGIINAKDGTQLLFAIYALGDVKDDAKVAIDNLATAIYRCGDTLSNE